MKKKWNKTLFDLDNADFLAVFEEFSDGVIVADADGVIVYYNQAMSRIDELKADDVLKSRVTDVYDLDETESIIMQCLNKRRPIIEQPIYYRTRMGKFANTIHSVFPVFKKNRMMGAICFVRDYNMLADTIASMPVPERDPRHTISSTTFEAIIGEDPAFREAIHSARLSSGTPSPVMLYGETGTGKELFARAIHNHSNRSTRMFTPVNCAAIPENLLEGILFGTSKGAFTGAVNKAGLFERTSNGTIFLDEINSMPVGLQAKILRIIQDSKVRRVGALKEIAFDLKIISSVNKDPHIAIADGTLRSDLFYRLGVVFIHIPPLRKRLDDLSLLVTHFIQKHNRLLHQSVQGISDNIMELFMMYNWPGNVRELEHVIEGAMNIVGGERTIRMKHLQSHFSNWSLKNRPGVKSVWATGTPKQGNPEGVEPDAGARQTDLIKDKAEHEKKMIMEALARNQGNISKSARSLGISRQLLYYNIRKFNIDRKQYLL